MKYPRVKLDSIKANGRYAFVGGPFGSNLTTRDYVEEGVPVIRGSNQSSASVFHDDDYVFVSEEKAVQLTPNLAFPGDVIFTQRGTLGQVGVIPQNAKYDRYVISQSQMKLAVHPEKAEAMYVYYYFRRPDIVQTIINLSQSSGVPHINLGTLKNFEIPLPPVDVQHRIISTLSAYDDLIENNCRRIELLEQSARMLYKEWFVSLRFPGHEHVKINDGVPHGWEKKRLADWATLVMGQSPASEHYNTHGDGLPFHQGVTNFGGRFVEHETYCNIVGRIGEAGDILCSVRAPVGRLNITLDRIIIGRGLSAIRSIYGYQSFLYYQLKNHFFKEDMIGAGAIFASVTKKDMENQLLLCPPNHLIEDFEQSSKLIDEQLKVLHIQNQKLKQARDLLLPRLMNGEIPV
jgi:type I restriction enzyme, S subunit